MPKVTVLLAVYNGEPYLGETIRSVLDQTWSDFEFLIVDDGSTDGTVDIVESYADTRIRLLRNEQNIGLARSLNRGLRQARGEYLARQDADDLSEPRRLEYQTAFLDARPDVALVGSWYTEMSADGRTIAKRQLPCEYTAIRWALLFFCPFVHSAVMFRRALITTTAGEYDESLSYSLDYQLWARVARLHPVANLPRYLLRLRTHPQSMTATFGERSQEGHRLRLAAVAHLLEWRDNDSANDLRFRAMSALLHRGGGDFAPRMVLRAIDDLLQLHETFCAAHQLSAVERQHQRAALLRQVRWGLVRHANRLRKQADYSGAWCVLTRAGAPLPRLTA